MDYPESKYYRLTVQLLSLVGQNFYRKDFLVTLQRFFIIISIASAILTQFAALVEEHFRAIILVDVVPSVMTAIISLLLCYPFYTDLNNSEALFYIMKTDWGKEILEEEKKIKHKYAEMSKMITTYFTAYVCMGIVFVMLSGFTSQVLDVIMPLNESRLRRHPFEFEAYVDKQKYFYTLLVYGGITVIAIMLIILANESLMVVFSQHACGMFAVIGYRLENLTCICRKGGGNENQYRQAIINNVIHCFREHSNALRFSSLLTSFAKIPGFIALGGTVISLSVSLFAITNPHLITEKTIPLGCGHFVQLFLICYCAQVFTDASVTVNEKLYNGEWYDYPLLAQKLLLMMILRSQKPCVFMAGNIYALSMQNFSAVTQTALSYCMVLRQMQ